MPSLIANPPANMPEILVNSIEVLINKTKHCMEHDDVQLKAY